MRGVETPERHRDATNRLKQVRRWKVGRVVEGSGRQIERSEQPVVSMKAISSEIGSPPRMAEGARVGAMGGGRLDFTSYYSTEVLCGQ